MSQVKREDWLEEGLKTLATEGVEALTIDALCKVFSVTKGSFYHHFKNRQNFLEALLEFWEEKYTKQFIDHSLEGENVLEQLDRLQKRVIASFGPAEVNIRAWAQADPLARVYQERVDKERIEFLYQLQLKLKTKPEIARAMAHLQYAALIGSAQIFPPLKAEDLEQMYRLISRLVQWEAEKKEDS